MNKYFIRAAAATAAAAIAALFSCGDDDDTSGQPAHYTLIEKARWGLIENDCSEATAKANSDALQSAIDSLAGAGEYRLRLERGDYCIWGVDDGARRKMIKIPSNIALDLDGSTIRLSPNDEPWTAIFEIRNAENVKLFNGTLIGDRETHTYGRLTGVRSEFGRSKDWGSHEWGWGIRVYSSHNIELYDLTIREFTGDCIIVGEVSPKCSRVTIRNNKLSRARRNGFVATNVDGLIIRDNHIFDNYNDVVHRDENGNIIYIGAEAGIAFESVKTDGSEKITNVEIYNNILDGTRSSHKVFLNVHQGSENIVVRDNVTVGRFELRYGNNILFKNNKASDGWFIPGGAVNRNNWVRNSTNIIIEGNEFYGFSIEGTQGRIYDGHPDYKQNFTVIGNKFYNGGLVTVATCTNMAIIDNEFITDTIGYAGILVAITIPPSSGIEHKLYIVGNKIPRRDASTNIGFNYPRLYHFPELHSEYFRLNDDEPFDKTRHRDIPEWYSESNNRNEAMAWVNSWKWF